MRLVLRTRKHLSGETHAAVVIVEGRVYTRELDRLAMHATDVVLTCEWRIIRQWTIKMDGSARALASFSQGGIIRSEQTLVPRSAMRGGIRGRADSAHSAVEVDVV